ncbi:MAG: prefoldin subunit alpha [Candidatus Hadarchaeales archaeon]
MEKEEKLRDAFSQLSSYREMARILQQQIAELTNVRSELSMTLNFLQEMKKMKEGDQVLVPAGSGLFVKTRLDSTDHVLVGIGANVVIERTPVEAQQILENRIKEIDETLQNLQESLAKVEEKIRVLAPEVERLMREKQKEI